jgi:hypothetical protein
MHMPVRKSDYQKALRDPTSVYATPEQVLADPRLDRYGKREILKTWQEDAEQLQRAEEEGMMGGERNMLTRVRQALDRLSVC